MRDVYSVLHTLLGFFFVEFRVWLGLWCETPIPDAAMGRNAKLRPSRRRSVGICLASDHRQDLNGETVAVSRTFPTSLRRGMMFGFFAHNVVREGTNLVHIVFRCCIGIGFFFGRLQKENGSRCSRSLGI